jgi:hypothetical protein
LHAPYTLWHLSYVALGAAAAPSLHIDRLVATLAAFFFAVGICAHALDELNGRPLQTRLSETTLVLLSVTGLVLAIAIGAIGVITVSAGLLVFMALGSFLVLSYNLELFGGRFHNDIWFALSWGAFPCLTSYWINALSITLAGVLTVAACFAFSLAQRHLSTAARQLRRRTISVDGKQILNNGETIPLSRSLLAKPLESSLKATSVAICALAIAAVVIRL